MPAKISDLTEVFGNLIRSVLGLAAIVFFVLLLIGGFRYMTSGGDPKVAETARKMLTSAVAGLIIILISYLILLLIKAITGVDVTSFSVTLS